MRTRVLLPVVLLVTVALVVVAGACLVHADDGAPDLCSSLVAATTGVMLALSLGRPQQIVFAQLDSSHPSSFEPPAPPPKI
jgi:hypothetical protein